MSRAGVAAWAIGAGVALTSVGRAWALTWSDAGLPGWDGADYELRARTLRDAALGADASGLVHALGAPALHPAGHPALLAAVAMVVPDLDLAAAIAAGLSMVVALVGLIGLGHLALPDGRGVVVGGVAALLTSLSPQHLWFVASPLAEPTALVAIVGIAALGTRVSTRSARGALLVGTSLAAAGSIRYALWPIGLGAALLVWVSRRERPIGLGLVALPTLALVTVWALLAPDLLAVLRGFFVNRTSSLSWTEHVVWLPRTVWSEYGLAGLLGLAALPVALWEAVRRPDGSPRPPLWILALATVAIAAAWLHPYKVARTLHPAMPLLWLGVGLELARLPLPRGRGVAALLAALTAAWAIWVHAVAFPARVDRGTPWPVDPDVTAALAFIAARPSGLIEVVGSFDRLSMPAVRLARPGPARGPWPALAGEDRSGASSEPSEAYAASLPGRVEALPPGTEIVGIRLDPSSRWFEGSRTWRGYEDRWIDALSASRDVVPVDTLHTPTLTVLVWRPAE